jgi:hypothetical protein
LGGSFFVTHFFGVMDGGGMNVETDFERFFGGAFDMNDGTGLDNVVGNETQMFGHENETEVDFIGF